MICVVGGLALFAAWVAAAYWLACRLGRFMR